MQTIYNFHEDGGHGWIEVPRDELKRLGITSRITPYSYIRGNFAFLEEDCDMSTFMHAKKDRGEPVELQRVFTDYESPIRGYRPHPAGAAYLAERNARDQARLFA